MISIDFSQPSISGNALIAQKMLIWDIPAHFHGNAGSGPHSDGIKHSRSSSVFGMFQYQPSNLILNSQFHLWELLIRSWEYLGWQEGILCHRILFNSGKICFYTNASGHWTQNFREVTQENNKSCKIHSIFKSFDPAWIKYFFSALGIPQLPKFCICLD